MVTVASMIILLGFLSGLFLFRKNIIPVYNPLENYGRISVIIPARNEEYNLPLLLESLKKQTLKPFEIIVVDDHSTDFTRKIAESYNVNVIAAPDLPLGWTGKNWAVWNGYLNAKGDLFIFLDADIQMEPNALATLVAARDESGGVISIVPFHKAKKYYEKLAMVLNLLGAFTFTSPFEKKNKKQGLYGSCILTTREDYEKIGGHESIKAEMLDDLNLGAKFQAEGIRITNFIGYGFISFRMYPNGLKSELEGFAKGAVLSTSTISVATLALIVVWIIGLLLSGFFLLFINSSFFFPVMFGYILYSIQIMYFNQYVGNFGLFISLFHFFSTVFFIIVIIYSVYQAVFRKKVIWKGRYINVGKGEQK